MASIREFVVGRCRHPECMGLKGGSFAPRDFPARAYLVETPHAKFLWDTGYSRHFLAQTQGLYRVYRAVTPVDYCDAAESLLAQLANAGVRPQHLSAVMISHFHADHVAGLLDLPGIPVYASAEAWTSISGVTGLKALLRAHVPGLVPPENLQAALSFEQFPLEALPPALAPFEQGFRLSSDASVFAVPLPGHARGQTGCFVKTAEGWELLAFDACWDPRGYAELRGPSELSFLVQHDRAAYYGTLKKLNALHNQGVRIRLTHEPIAPAA